MYNHPKGIWCSRVHLRQLRLFWFAAGLTAGSFVTVLVYLR